MEVQLACLCTAARDLLSPQPGTKGRPGGAGPCVTNGWQVASRAAVGPGSGMLPWSGTAGCGLSFCSSPGRQQPRLYRASAPLPSSEKTKSPCGGGGSEVQGVSWLRPDPHTMVRMGR